MTKENTNKCLQIKVNAICKFENNKKFMWMKKEKLPFKLIETRNN